MAISCRESGFNQRFGRLLKLLQADNFLKYGIIVEGLGCEGAGSVAEAGWKELL